jgi:hypothetical protein
LGEEISGEKISVNKKKNLKTKGKYIAVLAAVVVACSFSFAAGLQQSSVGKVTSGFDRYGTSAQTVESVPEGQNVNQNSISGDSSVQDDFGVSNQENQPQPEGFNERIGSFGHSGRHGRGYAAESGGGYSSQQDGVVTSQNYNVTPERCCATGKIGTCHAW